jgi:membrane fusion protein (multidrug efflux system)
MKRTCFHYSLLTVILAALFLFACKGKKEDQAAIQMEVPVVNVIQQDVPLESEYVGQTYGESDVEVTARAEGSILSINFTEGSYVRKDQLLYTIDPETYQNRLDQAAGNLAEAKTMLAKTKADYDRIEPLARINAVSQRELVAAKAQYEASLAKVQSAEAACRNAEKALGYCNVLAPISGIIGISKARVGDYVSMGPSSMLNTISETGKIRVRFTVSEQEFMRLYRKVTSEGTSVNVRSKNIRMILSDGTDYPHLGSFSFANRQIDPTTGAMTMEALFDNPDRFLRPGQYVKVIFVTDLLRNVLLIPQRSVSEIQGIYQVYTLADSNRVAMKIVKPGPPYKDAYIIENGLLNSDKVIVSGSQFLRPGMVVIPKEMPWQPGAASNKPAV